MDEFNMSPKAMYGRTAPINEQPTGPVISPAKYYISHCVQGRYQSPKIPISLL